MPTPEPTPTVALEVGRWTSFGPEGGDVQALALDPERRDVVFAAAGGRVWRSDDGAARWTRTAVPDDGGDVVSLAWSPPHWLFAARPFMVLRSRDDGDTWERVSAELDPLVGEQTLKVVAAAQDGTAVFVATDLGVYVSEDAGATWATAGEIGGVESLAVDPAAPAHVVAGQSSSGSSSRDRGRTWRSFAMPGIGPWSDPPFRLKSFAFDPAQPGRYWAAALQGGVFETHDDGRSWTARNDGIDTPSTDLPGTRAIAKGAHEAELLLTASRAQLYRSTDGARTWQPAGFGLPSPDVSALAFVPRLPGVVFAGTLGGGVGRSDDGGVMWQPASRGLEASFVTALAVDPSDPARVYAVTSSSLAPLRPAGGGTIGGPGPVGRLWRSGDGGRSWEMLRASAPPAIVLDVVIDPAPPHAVYAVVSGEILRSNDRGSSWDLVGALPSSPPYGHLAVQPGGNVLVLAARSLLRSVDGGATWDDVKLDSIVEADFRHCLFSDVAVDPHDPQRMYAASIAGVVVSEDGGASWQGPATCAVVTLPHNELPTFVLPDPTTPGRVFYAGRSSVLVSDDNGRTFAEPAPDLPEFYFPSALGHDGERPYVALSGRGVFRLNDVAAWEPWDEGLGTTSVHDFALFPGPEPVLAAATGGRGVALREVNDRKDAASPP